MRLGNCGAALALGSTLACGALVACGGSVESGEGGAGARGGSGSSGGSGASGGSNNGGSNNGGSNNGGSNNGGTSNGGSSNAGGSNAGTGSGGGDAVAEQAVQDCFAMCNAAVSTPCPDGWNVNNCRGDCGNVFDRDGTCLDAIAAAYACVAAEGATTFTCDDDGHLSLKCGPCDDAARHFATECGETLACTF